MTNRNGRVWKWNPDEMMEDNYIDFLIDEALDEEEETMLNCKN